MRTKEEILKEEHSKIITNSDKIFRERPSLVFAAHNAMEVFAKQQAIAFAMHVLGKLKKDRSSWVAQENDDYIMAVSATVDHHYDKFIESQNK